MIKVYTQTKVVHTLDVVEKKYLDNALKDIESLRFTLENIWREAMTSKRDGRSMDASWTMERVTDTIRFLTSLEYEK